MAGRLLVFVILICVFDDALRVAAIDAQVLRPTPAGRALYSWHPRGMPWHFVFVPDYLNNPISVPDIMHSPGVIIGIPALKKRLGKLPSGEPIAWRDHPPDSTLDYPPPLIRDRILAFAKSHGIGLQLSPAFYDPPPIRSY